VSTQTVRSIVTTEAFSDLNTNGSGGSNEPFVCYRRQMTTENSLRDRFELRRQSDDLIYRFARSQRSDGSIGYKRDDGDYWIVQKPGWGWIAWDEASQSCTGRPWNALPQEQKDFPPEGDWVSRRGSKSYVYTLVYVS
jgi:hypothetical protein